MSILNFTAICPVVVLYVKMLVVQEEKSADHQSQAVSKIHPLVTMTKLHDSQSNSCSYSLWKTPPFTVDFR